MDDEFLLIESNRSVLDVSSNVDVSTRCISGARVSSSKVFVLSITLIFENVLLFSFIDVCCPDKINVNYAMTWTSILYGQTVCHQTSKTVCLPVVVLYGVAVTEDDR